MPESTIQIRKIRLRLRGVDAMTARAAANGLGEAIASGLTPPALGANRGGDVSRLDLGSVRMPRRPGAEAVRGSAASAVTDAVSRHLSGEAR